MSKYNSVRLHTAVAIAIALLFFAVIVGFVSNWVTAGAFLIGGIFFTLSCYLSYYGRCSFMFNNILDTNQSNFAAQVTNRLARQEVAARVVQEDLQPFTFKDQSSRQEEEDRIVRALLSQVDFPDNF